MTAEPPGPPMWPTDGAPPGDDSPRSAGNSSTFKVVALVLALLLVAAVSVSVTLLAINQRTPSAAPSPTADVESTLTASDAPTATPTPTVEPTDLSPTSVSELAAAFGDAVWRVEATGCGIAGGGTAFAVDDRMLVTNWHVVANDDTPVVVSRDGRRLDGRVVGWSSDPDVALVEVSQDLGNVLEIE